MSIVSEAGIGVKALASVGGVEKTSASVGPKPLIVDRKYWRMITSIMADKCLKSAVSALIALGKMTL
jgi:hypothetical protein